ncbi:hypothetical protein C8J57DRAFT_1092007 [Mycena rebaudengoi]|nr:hypothetical protein C8J57DRAFT_1092007 [Mycena rebaudengoi]
MHYGWIPLIIYVGFMRSNPQPSLIKCVCCCSIFLWSHLVCADSSALLHSVLYYAYLHNNGRRPKDLQTNVSSFPQPLSSWYIYSFYYSFERTRNVLSFLRKFL